MRRSNQEEPLQAASCQVAAADGEDKWAKGVQQGGRAGTWSMAFQIRGKRHSMTLYGSQAEAAVGYDLAGVWAHKAKGNNPDACTRYNFQLVWYPRRLLDELLEVADWEGLKGFITGLLTAGTLRKLVPFDCVGRRYGISDVELWRPQLGLELCINSRGIHFYRGSWTCVPMEDVKEFGATSSLLQLSYTPPSSKPGRVAAAVTSTFRCAQASDAYGKLQAAAAQRRQGGLLVPRDLGTAIKLPAGARVEQHTADVADDDLPDSNCPSEEYSVDDPSREELELFAEFAEFARSADLGACNGPHTGSGSGSGSLNLVPQVEAQPPECLPKQDADVADPVSAAGGQVSARGGESAAGYDACPTGSSNSALGSSSSAQAGSKPGSCLPEASNVGSLGSKRLERGAAGNLQDAEVGQHPPARKKPRAQQGSQQSCATQERLQHQQSPPQQQAAAQHPQELSMQQMLMLQQQQLHAMQMLQMGPGVQPMMPLGALPPGLLAALQQQQQAAAAAVASSGAVAWSAPFPPMAMVPVPVSMLPPAMAAAMQAQAAAMQAQAAAMQAQAARQMTATVTTGAGGPSAVAPVHLARAGSGSTSVQVAPMSTHIMMSQRH